MHTISLNLIAKELSNLGVIDKAAFNEAFNGSNSRLKTQLLERVVKYYPHRIGHYLGMDTHDTPSLSLAHPLTAGMVITIEPGLYFPIDDLQVVN